MQPGDVGPRDRVEPDPAELRENVIAEIAAIGGCRTGLLFSLSVLRQIPRSKLVQGRRGTLRRLDRGGILSIDHLRAQLLGALTSFLRRKRRSVPADGNPAGTAPMRVLEQIDPVSLRCHLHSE